MTNDLQPAVKKRLIYAEDLFEPVDFTVLQMGGRSGGKTMAMYEQLFRKRVEMAPTIEAVEVVRCKNCQHYEEPDEGDFLGLCRHGGLTVSNNGEIYPEPDYFCPYGKRRTDHGR